MYCGDVHSESENILLRSKAQKKRSSARLLSPLCDSLAQVLMETVADKFPTSTPCASTFGISGSVDACGVTEGVQQPASPAKGVNAVAG